MKLWLCKMQSSVCLPGRWSNSLCNCRQPLQCVCCSLHVSIACLTLILLVLYAYRRSIYLLCQSQHCRRTGNETQHSGAGGGHPSVRYRTLRGASQRASESGVCVSDRAHQVILARSSSVHTCTRCEVRGAHTHLQCVPTLRADAHDLVNSNL